MSAGANLHAIAGALDDQGLRPIVDASLRVIRADCPDCHGQRADPLELWRPLLVVPRPGSVAFICDACSIRVVRRA